MTLDANCSCRSYFPWICTSQPTLSREATVSMFYLPSETVSTFFEWNPFPWANSADDAVFFFCFFFFCCFFFFFSYFSQKIGFDMC